MSNLSKTESFDGSLTLRDHLASQRTSLANERTLLAYVRTAFGFAAAGGTLCKLFSDDRTMLSLGYLLILLGVTTLALGIYSFRSNLSRSGKMIDCFSCPNSESTTQ